MCVWGEPFFSVCLIDMDLFGAAQRAVNYFNPQTPNSAWDAPFLRSIQKPLTAIQNTLQKPLPQIINGANTFGKTLGQQPLINTPLFSSPNYQQVAKIIGPQNGESIASKFLSGHVEQVPQAAQQTNQRFLQGVSYLGAKNLTPEQKQTEDQFMQTQFPGAGVGFIAGPKAAGFKEAVGKFAATFDKQPRFEVSDKGAVLKQDWVKSGLGGAKLTDVLDHPALFKAYPELKNLVIKARLMFDKSLNGGFDKGENAIVLNSNLKGDAAKQTLLHEIQHVIQTKEGFAPGGGMSSETSSPIKTKIQTINEELNKITSKATSSPGDRERVDSLLGQMDQLQKASVYDSFDNYQRLGGEVEARSVADRSSLDQKQLATTPPYTEQGIKPQDVIVKNAEGKQMSQNNPLFNKTIGQIQEESQRGRGLGLLADFDKANREGNQEQIKKVVLQILRQPEGSAYDSYKPTLYSLLTKTKPFFKPTSVPEGPDSYGFSTGARKYVPFESPQVTKNHQARMGEQLIKSGFVSGEGFFHGGALPQTERVASEWRGKRMMRLVQEGKSIDESTKQAEKEYAALPTQPTKFLKTPQEPQGNIPGQLENPAQEAVPPVAKPETKQLVERMQQSDEYKKSVRKQLEGNYMPQTNEETIALAKSTVLLDPATAEQRALNPKSALDQALGAELFNKYMKEGNIEKANKIINATSGVNEGQMIQMLSNYDKTSPYGASLFAGNLIKAYNKLHTKDIGAANNAAAQVTKAVNTVNLEAANTVASEVDSLATKLKIKLPGSTVQKTEASQEAGGLFSESPKNPVKFLKTPEEMGNVPGRLENPMEEAVSQALGTQIRRGHVNLSDLVKEHYGTVSNVETSLEQKLVSRAGLDDVDAKKLAQAIQKRFAQLTQDKKKQLLTSMLKDHPQLRSDGGFFKQIIELSNLGAFDEKQYFPIIAKKLGVLSLSEKDARAISEAANKVQKMTDGREKNIASAKLINQVNNLIPSSFADKAITVWKAALLTSLRTHERNLLGNAIHGAAEIAKDIPANQVDRLLALRTGKRSLTFTTRGVGAGGAQGIKAAKDILQTGFDPEQDISKYDINRVTWGNNPVEQTLKHLTDAVFRPLGAEDKPFLYAAYARSLYDQAGAAAINAGKNRDTAFIKQLVANPTSGMKENALKDSAIAAFHNKTIGSKIASSIKNSIERLQTKNTTDETVKQLLKVMTQTVAPFTGVLSAIGGQVIAYSPIGLLQGIAKAGTVLAKNVPDLQREAAQEIGRGVVGSGLIGLGAYLQQQGLLTGQPKDIKESQQWQLENKPANSVLIGGKWRAIGSIGPENLLALAGAKYQQDIGNQGNVGKFVGDVGKDFLGQTFLQGVQQPLQAIQDPARFGPSYVGGQASSIIPNIVKDVAKANDPYQRENNGVLDYLKNNIPFLRNQGIVKRDTLGNPLPQEPTGVDAFVDLFNSKSPVSNPVVDELSRLNAEDNNATPSKLAKRQTIHGTKSVLTPQQLDSLEEAVRPQVSEALRQLIHTDKYKLMDDSEKASAINTTVSRVRATVRATVKLPGEPIPQSPAKIKKAAAKAIKPSASLFSGSSKTSLFGQTKTTRKKSSALFKGM